MTHAEVKARLAYAAQHRQVALVTGDTGVGKTTAVRAAMHGLDPSRYQPIYIATAGLTPKTLYRILLERLLIEPKFRHTENQALVREALLESYNRGRQVVLILDEAHELEPVLLGEFRFLLNFREDSFSPFSLWLVGQTELKEKVRLRVLTSLAQRIGVRYHMSGMSEEELKSYMQEQIRHAGKEQTIFSGEAMKQVAKLTKGVARVTNTVCKAALLDAATRDEHVVDVGNVERAWLEVTG